MAELGESGSGSDHGPGPAAADGDGDDDDDDEGGRNHREAAGERSSESIRFDPVQ